MILMELTIRIEDGKITAPIQHEMENLALETIGTAEDIYSGETPINDTQYFKFDRNINAWVLHNKGETRT